jgi:hypothetical protein
VDVHVTYMDAKSYVKQAPAKVLKTQEKEKKRKYLEPCLENRHHFTPFVGSVDDLLGHEAKTFAKRLAAKLAKDVWVCHCSFEHCRCAHHPPLSGREQCPCTQNQHTESSLGGRC